MSTEELNRLRWQCRRGVLELDLVLERFIEWHGEHLQGEHLTSFKTLLSYADTDLLDLIHARAECRDDRLAEMVQWMRNCKDRSGSQCSSNCEDDDGVHS